MVEITDFDEFMANVTAEMEKAVDEARRSGALPGDIPNMALYKIVLQIVAERFRPLSQERKQDLKNLRNFI